eukprot:5374432-Amphidinium_carterae.2
MVCRAPPCVEPRLRDGESGTSSDVKGGFEAKCAGPIPSCGQGRSSLPITKARVLRQSAQSVNTLVGWMCWKVPNLQLWMGIEISAQDVQHRVGHLYNRMHTESQLDSA